jgi:hypothetical protein
MGLGDLSLSDTLAALELFSDPGVDGLTRVDSAASHDRENRPTPKPRQVSEGLRCRGNVCSLANVLRSERASQIFHVASNWQQWLPMGSSWI